MASNSRQLNTVNPEEHTIARLLADDQQIKDAAPVSDISAAIREPGLRLSRMLETLMEGYGDRPAFGERAQELVSDPDTGRTSLRLLPEFHTITYRELWARTRSTASEWHHHPEHPLSAGDFVGVLGFTSVDYVTVDMACIHLGAVSVPLQSGASAAQLAPIIAETKPHTLATTIENLDTAVQVALAAPSLRRLVVFDYHEEADSQREHVESAREELARAGGAVVLDSLAAVRARGDGLPRAPLFEAGDGEDPLTMLIYTSGTTGTPKGAMYTERLVAGVWRGFWPGIAEIPVIGINYMPLSHLAGRTTVVGTLTRGGTGYFTARSDLSTLLDDINLVRPTELFLVPRVGELLFQLYQNEMARPTDEAVEPEVTDTAVKEYLREELLGGRVVRATCVSAPMSPELVAFLRSCLRVEPHDAYGSTEAGAILRDTRLQSPPVIDYKLVDVPELGYFRTDSPHPRGELLVRTATIIPGYYKRPDLNEEIFDEDGYYRTGDILAETGPGQLVYVDRRKNVLKLSQGEFVAVARLETIFVASPLVHQIFVYGSSERAYLLAVVVPTRDEIQRGRWDDGELKQALRESLQEVAKAANLNPYEIPRDFLVETEPFSNVNGLLSDTRKLLRPALVRRYGHRLEDLYSTLAEEQITVLRELRRADRDLPTHETVLRATQAILGRSATDLDPDAHFTELGGDSLSALTFVNLLRDVFDLELPVGVVMSPANSLRQLANHIEAQRELDPGRPTFASVHGEHSAVVRGSDLALEKFIGADILAGARTLPRAAANGARNVLLTGATGFLGRFLCLEWLERLEQTGGSLICVVRGSSAAAARRRLEEAFDLGDPELVDRFHKLAAGRLEVLGGDISEPNFGLPERSWRRLAETVDLIVHPAAMVNHVLPYRQLFGPNVAGTAELIRMAVTERIKPFVFVSTVAVASQGGPEARDEDTDIRVSSQKRELDESYANGYATSKWAGEVLLREAHETCGLPVVVFRAGMILAHSRYTGQLNVPDMFTRLLLSVLATGIAPRSFYRTDNAGNRQRAHYDGLPVDFVAEAVTTIGEDVAAGFRTFNAVNPYDDGVSLDVFVDWLIRHGERIQRIDDHADWFARFETAVRALPEKQRQQSVLPLLHAFAHPDEAIRGSTMSAERFRAAVRDAGVGLVKDIPQLSSTLIEKYADDLRSLGLL